MKLTKQDPRLRRARRGRVKIKELAALRLSVHRTPQHIYAQIFAADGDKVLVAASTVQKDVRGALKTTGNIEAAKAVGRAIAGRATAAGVAKGASKRWPRPPAKPASSSNRRGPERHYGESRKTNVRRRPARKAGRGESCRQGGQGRQAVRLHRAYRRRRRRGPSRLRLRQGA